MGYTAAELEAIVYFRITESTAYQRRPYCDLLLAPDVASYSTFVFVEPTPSRLVGKSISRVEGS